MSKIVQFAALKLFAFLQTHKSFQMNVEISGNNSEWGHSCNNYLTFQFLSTRSFKSRKCFFKKTCRQINFCWWLFLLSMARNNYCQKSWVAPTIDLHRTKHQHWISTKCPTHFRAYLNDGTVVCCYCAIWFTWSYRYKLLIRSTIKKLIIIVSRNKTLFWHVENKTITPLSYLSWNRTPHRCNAIE